MSTFERMKKGMCSEKEFCLRLKIDHQHPNATLRDPVIYRIKRRPHPRTKDIWKIYPTYDMSHCICDSLENITFSLCTLEFEVRRDLYYMILDLLDLYKPRVIEYSRLNLSYNILSKRLIKALIDKKLIEDWDDPRLLTIDGLKKRGVTQSALLNFIDKINISRASNENIIEIELLNHCLRNDLQKSSHLKSMAVLDPVKLVIENVGKDFLSDITTPAGIIRASKINYVERRDIRTGAFSEDFYGFQVG